MSWWVDSVSSLVRPRSTLKDFVVEIPLDDVVDLDGEVGLFSYGSFYFSLALLTFLYEVAFVAILRLLFVFKK